jgi:hypothetical protein
MELCFDVDVDVDVDFDGDDELFPVIKTSGSIKQEKASNQASRKRPSSTQASKHPSIQATECPMEATTKHPSINTNSIVKVRAQVSKQEDELISEE